MLTLIPVHQTVNDETVPDVATAVDDGLARLPLSERIRPGMRVAVAVGSRGIAGYREVVRTTVDALLALGAKPFLVPAMGSHGGGTTEGQRQVLVDGGMGPDDLGVPIHSSMETVPIGETPDGMPVFWDAHAAGADAVIAINRVKAHTAFRGAYESGLCKILTIGLGKKRGAEIIHARGVASAMPAAARVALAAMPVVAGIALVENGAHGLARVAVLPAEKIEAEEPGLLSLARSLQPTLPLDPLDLLVVGEMGKEISGTGMDTNVVGMWRRNGGPREPDYGCLVCLDLTAASHGNASGVGMADIISARLRDKIDWQATYTNCRTAGNFAGAKLPMTLPTDREVIETALGGVDREMARVVYIRNTLALEEFWVSPALLDAVDAHPALAVRGPAVPLAFDSGGALLAPDRVAVS